MHRVNPRAAYITILATQGFARGLLIALLAYWVVQARLDALQLVLLGTALEGTLFLAQIPTGAFADAVGRRPAAVIGYGGLGMGLGLQAFAPDFGSLLVLQAFSGVAWAFIIGSVEAWVSERAGSDRLERVFLRGGQAQLIGLMGGMGLTLIVGQADARAPIVAGGAVLVLVTVAAAALMEEAPRPRTSLESSRWHDVVAAAGLGLRRIRASRVLALLVVVGLALGVSSEGWDRLYTAHLMRDLGLESVGHLSPVGWLALIGLAESVAGVAVFQVAAGRLDGRDPGRVLAAIYVARAVLMLAFAFLPSLFAALLAYLAAETVGRLGQPLLDAWISRETLAEIRATVLSVVGQADSLGQIVAGPVVGLVCVVASVQAALGVTATLLLPASVLVLAAGRPRETMARMRPETESLKSRR